MWRRVETSMTYRVKWPHTPSFGTSTGQCAPPLAMTEAVGAINKTLKANPQVDARKIRAFGTGNDRSPSAEVPMGQEGQASGAGDGRPPVAADRPEVAIPSTSGAAASAGPESDVHATSTAIEAQLN